MNFGQFVKELRIEAEITLREFSKRIGMDPSNWSKMERGITPPPSNSELLENLVAVLELNPEQKQQLEDLASLARRELPADLDDEAILAKLPAFFRAIKGREYTADDLQKMIDDVREINEAD